VGKHDIPCAEFLTEGDENAFAVVTTEIDRCYGHYGIPSIGIEEVPGSNNSPVARNGFGEVCINCLFTYDGKSVEQNRRSSIGL
jgi:hypothetical protein